MVHLNKKNQLHITPTHQVGTFLRWFQEVTSAIGPYDSQRIKMTQVHCSQLERWERASERGREGGRSMAVRWNARGGTTVVDSSGCELLLINTSAMADDSNENIFLDRPSPSQLSSQNHQADCLAFAFHSCALTDRQTSQTDRQTDRRQKSKVEASITDQVFFLMNMEIATNCEVVKLS